MTQKFEHIQTRKPMVVSLSVKAIIYFCLTWKNWLVDCLKIWSKISCCLTWKTSLSSHCLIDHSLIFFLVSLSIRGWTKKIRDWPKCFCLVSETGQFCFGRPKKKRNRPDNWLTPMLYCCMFLFHESTKRNKLVYIFNKIRMYLFFSWDYSTYFINFLKNLIKSAIKPPASCWLNDKCLFECHFVFLPYLLEGRQF